MLALPSSGFVGVGGSSCCSSDSSSSDCNRCPREPPAALNLLNIFVGVHPGAGRRSNTSSSSDPSSCLLRRLWPLEGAFNFGRLDRLLSSSKTSSSAASRLFSPFRSFEKPLFSVFEIVFSGIASAAHPPPWQITHELSGAAALGEGATRVQARRRAARSPTLGGGLVSTCTASARADAFARGEATRTRSTL
eukprot:3403130-Prymnesium_polylepis.1